MKLLDRYIAKNVLSSIVLVSLMLIGLQIFILFVNQLGDLGKGDYGIMEAATFVLLDMPYEVYLFFPMATLLGCLVGLGAMANHHELVVMRASGMSIGQIMFAVLNVAIILVLVVTLLGELVMPNLVSMARDVKAQAMSNGQALRTPKGVWVRYKNDFIAITNIVANNQLQDVHQFHFDKSHHLQYARTMAEIDYKDGVWTAHGVLETILHAKRSQVQEHAQMIWDVPLKPSTLGVSSREPDEMTLRALYQYVRAQKVSHQSVRNYQLVFWQRIIQPVTTVVMMLLAIPFIFGPLRSSTMGSKLLAGATVGFGFHILNRFFGSMSQVYQLSSVLAAVGPTCLFACLGLYLMRRVK